MGEKFALLVPTKFLNIPAALQLLDWALMDVTCTRSIPVHRLIYRKQVDLDVAQIQKVMTDF